MSNTTTTAKAYTVAEILSLPVRTPKALFGVTVNGVEDIEPAPAHIGQACYRLDIMSGSARLRSLDTVAGFTDPARFPAAVRGEWYRREALALDTIAARLPSIGDEAYWKDARSAASASDVKKARAVVEEVVRRVQRARELVEPHAREASVTVAAIVAAVRGDVPPAVLVSCLEPIVAELKRLDGLEQAGTTPDMSALRGLVTRYISDAWQASEADGVRAYTRPDGSPFKASAGLTADVYARRYGGRKVGSAGKVARTLASAKTLAGEMGLAILQYMQEKAPAPETSK